MARSEHYLFRAKPSPWPKAVIALHVGVAWKYAAESAWKERCELSYWSVAIVTREKSGNIISRCASGATVAGFWGGMVECLNRSKGCTLICSCTREAAATLQLWERLENGEITISGRDHRSRDRRIGHVPSMPKTGKGIPLGAGEQVDKSGVPKLQDHVGKTRGNRRGNSANGSAKSPGIMIVNDPPVVMDLRLAGSQYKLIWLDAMNYSVDCRAAFGDNPDTAKRLAEWYISAAESLKSLGDCGWQNTAGSQAMHLYRSTYLDAAILSHTHPAVCDLERDALFGGRCECFRIGRCVGPVHLYDVRSMYPYLCANLPVPVRLRRVVERPTKDDLRLLDAAMFHIADVAIETDEPDYPRRNIDNVSYPTGRYWSVLAGAELEYAVRSGRVRGVRRLASYETEPAISRYAHNLYRLRCQYDMSNRQHEASYIKRLMVSVVGKFAQTERRWVDCPDAESAFEWGEWWGLGPDGDVTRWRSIAGYVQREEKGGWSHGAVPAITVCVTSAGRNRLCRIIHAAGRGNVLYCDTDAVIVNDYGVERLMLSDWIRPGEWGYLQHVESAGECTIYGDKYYTIGSRTRCSGGGGGASGDKGKASAGSMQPWIGWSLRHQQRPADWREYHPNERGEGRYDRVRAPGGVVKPVELWEW